MIKIIYILLNQFAVIEGRFIFNYAKFDVPGIYAYSCTPHKGMGMIGFLIVGDDKSNLDAIKAIKYFGKSKQLALDLINSL